MSDDSNITPTTLDHGIDRQLPEKGPPVEKFKEGLASKHIPPREEPETKKRSWTMSVLDRAVTTSVLPDNNMKREAFGLAMMSKEDIRLPNFTSRIAGDIRQEFSDEINKAPPSRRVRAFDIQAQTMRIASANSTLASYQFQKQYTLPYMRRNLALSYTKTDLLKRISLGIRSMEKAVVSKLEAIKMNTSAPDSAKSAKASYFSQLKDEIRSSNIKRVAGNISDVMLHNNDKMFKRYIAPLTSRLHEIISDPSSRKGGINGVIGATTSALNGLRHRAIEASEETPTSSLGKIKSIAAKGLAGGLGSAVNFGQRFRLGSETNEKLTGFAKPYSYMVSKISPFSKSGPDFSDDPDLPPTIKTAAIKAVASSSKDGSCGKLYSAFQDWRHEYTSHSLKVLEHLAAIELGGIPHGTPLKRVTGPKRSLTQRSHITKTKTRLPSPDGVIHHEETSSIKEHEKEDHLPVPTPKPNILDHIKNLRKRRDPSRPSLKSQVMRHSSSFLDSAKKALDKNRPRVEAARDAAHDRITDIIDQGKSRGKSVGIAAAMHAALAAGSAGDLMRAAHDTAKSSIAEHGHSAAHKAGALFARAKAHVESLNAKKPEAHNYPKQPLKHRIKAMMSGLGATGADTGKPRKNSYEDTHDENGHRKGDAPIDDLDRHEPKRLDTIKMRSAKDSLLNMLLSGGSSVAGLASNFVGGKTKGLAGRTLGRVFGRGAPAATEAAEDLAGAAGKSGLGRRALAGAGGLLKRGVPKLSSLGRMGLKGGAEGAVGLAEKGIVKGLPLAVKGVGKVASLGMKAGKFGLTKALPAVLKASPKAIWETSKFAGKTAMGAGKIGLGVGKFAAKTTGRLGWAAAKTGGSLLGKGLLKGGMKLAGSGLGIGIAAAVGKHFVDKYATGGWKRAGDTAADMVSYGAMGSMFGPVGTVVGAAIGALVANSDYAAKAIHGVGSAVSYVGSGISNIVGGMWHFVFGQDAKVLPNGRVLRKEKSSLFGDVKAAFFGAKAKYSKTGELISPARNSLMGSIQDGMTKFFRGEKQADGTYKKGSSILDQMRSAISNVSPTAGKVIDKVGSVASNIASGASNALTSAGALISSGASAAGDAISSGASAIYQGAKNAGSFAIGSLKDALTKIIGYEGGPKLVTDTGGLTKYGISAKNNPGVDIKNLTEDQAREIYAKKYAAPLGLDKYPPAVAMVALDASVNQGPGYAKKLLAEGGGDPSKMIQIRRQMYESLAQKNPGKYGKYLKGWQIRMDKLTRDIGPAGASAAAASAGGGKITAPAMAGGASSPGTTKSSPVSAPSSGKSSGGGTNTTSGSSTKMASAPIATPVMASASTTKVSMTKPSIAATPASAPDATGPDIVVVGRRPTPKPATVVTNTSIKDPMSDTHIKAQTSHTTALQSSEKTMQTLISTMADQTSASRDLTKAIQSMGSNLGKQSPPQDSSSGRGSKPTPRSGNLSMSMAKDVMTSGLA